MNCQLVYFAILSIAILVSNVSTSTADEPKHIAIVVGTTHYSPEKSMPIFAKELERLGFKVSLIMGEGDPEKKLENVLPGIEELANVDSAIFFMRFLKLPDPEFKAIENYLQSGKPFIGLRTTTHSFKYKKDHSHFHWNDGFGRRAMGTPYVVHQAGTTEVNLVGNDAHPILANLPKKTWTSAGSLYLTRLESGCHPLVTGTGKGRNRIVNRAFGPTAVNEIERDFVAWHWTNEWGGKVFGTSFGHTGDFAEESFTRMLVNSVYWSVDLPVPGPDVKINTWKIERVDKKKKSKK